MFVKTSLRDRLVCFANFVGMNLLALRFLLPSCLSYASSLPPTAPFKQLFSQSPSSHTLCSCLEVLSTTNNLCNFLHSKFQQVSTYAFRRWDDIFTQKGTAVVPITFASAPNPRPRCRPTSL